jgi:hypothetical protein
MNDDKHLEFHTCASRKITFDKMVGHFLILDLGWAIPYSMHI